MPRWTNPLRALAVEDRRYGWQLSCKQCGACCPVHCDRFEIRGGKAFCTVHNDRMQQGLKCAMDPAKVAANFGPNLRGHYQSGEAVPDEHAGAHGIVHGCVATQAAVDLLFGPGRYDLTRYIERYTTPNTGILMKSLLDAQTKTQFEARKRRLELSLIKYAPDAERD